MWSGNAVPSIGDTVNINAPGSSVNVTDSERSDNITTAVNTALHIDAGGYLFLDNGGTIAGSLAVDAALGQTAAGQIGAGNSVALTFSGTTTMNGVFYQGTFTNAGTLNLNAAAFNSSGTLTNNATANIINGFNFGSSLNFLNSGTGTVNLNDDAGLTGNGTLTNSGTLALTAGSGGGTAGLSGLQLQDSGGTISVQTGTLADEQTAYFSNATFTIASGAAFALDPISSTNNGDAFYFTGTSTGSGAGHVLFNGGQIIPGSTGGAATSAVLNLPSGLAQVTGSYFAVNPQDGTVQKITNTGFLSYTGSAQHGDMGFVNQGTVTVSGTGNLDVDSNGSFDNAASGILDFQTDAGVLNAGGNTAFTNEGLIEKTGGTGVSVIGIAAGGDISFSNNGGGYNVQTGTISLQNGGNAFAYAAGPITVASGATLNIDASIVTTGTFSSSGGGQVTFTGGNWAGPSGGESPSVLNFTPGAFTVSGGVFVGSQAGGIVTNDGTLEYTGANTIQELNNAGIVLFNDAGPLTFQTGTVTNEASGTFDFTANTPIDVSGNIAVNNLGTIEKTGGSGVLDLNPLADALTNSGVVRSEDGSINLPYTRSLFGYFGDTIQAGATYEADGGAAITIASPFTPPAINEGTVILNGAGSHFDGLNGLTTNNGTLELLNGASLTTAAALSNSGTLNVGGKLTVSGNFVESGSPTLNFAVSGLPNSAGAPLLSVTGTTTLIGALTAEYAGGIGSNGDAYTVANFSSASGGGFSSTSGVGPAFTVALHPTSIVLNGGNLPAVAAKADSYSVQGNSFITVPTNQGVLTNDTDPNARALTAVQLTNPSHGLLAFNADGSFTYQPFNGFKGVDSFSYYATDGAVTSTPTTVTLNVGLVQPAFTNLSTPSTITYGTATATFSGVISAGSAYPPVGENVTVTLNGVSQSATVGNNGTFSSTFNTANLSASLTAYAVTYSYAGDSSFLSAANTATTTVTVNKASASIVLGNLNQSYSGSAEFASATTLPVGLTVSITYSQNGNGVTNPTAAGSYAVTATIASANYQGSQTGTLVITNTGASLSFSGSTSATYDGNTHTVSVTTSPTGLSGVTIAYTQNGSPVVSPTNAGTYNVVATLNNPNYTASQISETLTIAQATTTFSGLTAPISFTGPTATVPGQPTPPYTGPVVATLGGVIASNGIYPPIGETVAITLDGVTQNATIGANGAFSSLFTLLAVPETSTPFPVTYAYSSDGNFQAASNNTATTVTDLPPVVAAGTKPVVTLNPVSQTVSGSFSSFVTFTASATGTPTPSQQWQVSSNGGLTFSNVIASPSYLILGNELIVVTNSSLNGDEYRAVFTNTAGTATSTAATLTLTQTSNLPIIVTAPVNQSVVAGQTATFTASATNAGFVVWQVSTDGGSTFSDIPGTYTTTYSFTATTSESGYEYRAIFTGAGGSTTTSAATLTVTTAATSAPIITLDPVSQSATAGASVTLVAAAIGSPSPTVQWQISTDGGNSFANLPFATSTNYQFVANPVLNNDQFRAVFTNSVGSKATRAATFTLAVLSTGIPVVTLNPATQGVLTGQTVTFTAAATGTPTPTVQWQSAPAALALYNVFTNIPGATSTSYSFVATQNGIVYRAVFTNSAGKAITTDAALSVGSLPLVTVNPVSTGFLGASQVATVSATATGIPLPTVQWQGSVSNGANANFVNLPAADSATNQLALLAGNVQSTLTLPRSAGYLYVRAVYTNAFGTATSAIASLTATAPLVTTNPTSQTVTPGTQVTFNAAASGSPSPTVQWQVAGSAFGAALGNFTNIAGATSASYSFTATAGETGYEYRAVFTNSFGQAVTTAATLTVGSAPIVTLNPVSKTLSAATARLASFSFTAAASGTSPVTVQWQLSTNGGASFTNIYGNGAFIPIGNTGTLEILSDVSGDNGYQFRAVFTNAFGSATTSAATLTVQQPPVVTVNPVSQTISAGQRVSFGTNATNATSVQWQVSTNGGISFNNIPGATGIVYAFNTTASENGYEYRSVFSNASGSSPTTAAKLTVLFAPIIQVNPSATAVNTNTTATFVSQASASPSATVQWQVSSNGGRTFTNIAGATSTTYSFTTTSTQNNYQYRAVFTNAQGSVPTTAATLTVYYLTVTQQSTFTTINGVYGQIGKAVGNPTPTAVAQVSTNGGATYTNLPASDDTVTTSNGQVTIFLPYSFELPGDRYLFHFSISL